MIATLINRFQKEKHFRRCKANTSHICFALTYLLKHGTTGNDLQRARNDLKRPEPTYNEQNKRTEATSNEQILKLFYNMGKSVPFFDTFSAEHLIAIIQALLHGESW